MLTGRNAAPLVHRPDSAGAPAPEQVHLQFGADAASQVTVSWAAPAAVARLARDAGIDSSQPPGELIATCGSGVSATVALRALERIGVYCDGVYDGSFNEWSADPERPVDYGSAVPQARL